jgi:hypothetical protein
MDTPFELVREELRLRWEIAAHELACLMEDDAAADVLDAKLEECKLIMARQEDLERRMARADELAAG